MTALLLTEVFPPQTGGSGRWFWEIYRRLPRESVAIAAGEHPEQCEFDRTHDLRIVRLPLALSSWGIGRPMSLYRHGCLVRTVRRLMRQYGIDQLHCGKCLPEGTIALALKWLTGTPYIVYAHGEEIQFVRSSRELTWLTRQVLMGASRLIANCQNTKRILVEHWEMPHDRVRVLHPGVDVDRFVPSNRDAAFCSQIRWGQRPIVLTVGRLQKRKGHDVMIQALSRIRERIPDVLYAIVGDGEERDFLVESVKRLGLEGHVMFHGNVSDETMLRCYQQCDLFVLPNRQVGQDIEGFGMVLLEAQACGKPVVAGASGGTAETMRVPDTGVVISCEEPGGLAALLIELLSDRDRLTRMGIAGRQWVVERFDWRVLTSQAKRIWGECGLRQRRGARRRSTANIGRVRHLNPLTEANSFLELDQADRADGGPRYVIEK